MAESLIWEYTQIECFDHEVSGELNKLGALGWEPFQIDYVFTSNMQSLATLHVKRSKNA